MKKIYIIVQVLLTITLLMFCNIAYSSNLEKSILKPVIPSLAPMLERIIPSIVSINVEGVVSIRKHRLSDFSPSLFDPNSILYKNTSFLQYSSLHLNSYKKNRIFHKNFHALGSGVIINSKEGYVVTNNHVVENVKTIKVNLSDGRCYSAKIVGRDRRSDIALLKLTIANNLTAITISNSDLVKVGDFAIAIGNPYGLGETVTSGIISALGRSGLHLKNYENFIQTDAAINRGNSGGALVNLQGELIGINTAILAPNGGNIGIGFAIPSNMIRHVTQQIIKYGRVTRIKLGIIGTELNADIAKIMRLNSCRGALVSEVLKYSLAEKSGIKSGDIIVSINKKFISNFSMFRAEMSMFTKNTKIRLGILRKGFLYKIVFILKDDINQKIYSLQSYKFLIGAFGCNYYNFKKNQFIKLYYVLKDSLAYDQGFKQNDIIIDVNNYIIHNLNNLKIILSKKIDLVVFHIQRENNIIYLVLQE
ncbi:Periplasmic serine endoprotease DegP [Buchnera aphidicola (Eriosoma grossulariae)]|uniref:Do family serine endopeptidase n=1 Tax=Buchnera aphidicola TaxID=9 RepID=UPI003463FF1D